MFTLFAAVTLALGIGATTAIYSVVHALVLRPLDITDIDEVVNIYHSRPPGSGPMISMAWADLQDLRGQQTVFSGVMAFCRFRQPVTGSGVSDFVMGEIVTGNYFDVLRIRAGVGRVIQPADDRPGAPPVVVVSDAFWRQKLAGDPGIVGRRIKIGGATFTIAGVAEPKFRGVDMPNVMPTPMWIPVSAMNGLDPMLAPERMADREARQFYVKARLADGRTFEDAVREVAAIAGRLDRAYPIGTDVDARFRMPYMTERQWYVMHAADLHMHESVDPQAVPMAIAVMAAVGLVLLVACTNLANLMLARQAGRAHETAVRLALGASRLRLVREHLVEGVMLAAIGGFAGLLVGRALMVWLTGSIHAGPAVTIEIEPRLNVPVVLVAAGATLVTLLVFALVPAVRSARTDVRSALVADSGQAALPRWRGRRLLIAAQVTVSTVLIALAMLSVQQMRLTLAHDFGVDLDHVAAAQVDFGAVHYDEVRARATLDRVAARIGGLSGVTGVAVASGLPLGSMSRNVYFATPEQPFVGDRIAGSARLVAGSPDVFRVLGVPILEGRGFDARDVAGAERVAVLSRVAARQIFGATAAIGRVAQIRRQRRVGEPDPPVEAAKVVGIAGDTDSTADGRRDRGVVYLPFSQHYESTMAVVARTEGDPSGLTGTLRSAVTGVDPDLIVLDAGTGMALAGADNLTSRITATVAGLLGLLALALAMAGLYGVLSHVVARRTRELGVRMALGADAGRIARQVLIEGVSPVVGGLVLGLTLGAIARLLLRPFVARLFPAMDATVLLIVPVPFLVAAMVACYLPARRAARVDPNVALRVL